MNDAIHIFIVDDNRLLREGLVSMLTELDDFVVVGTAGNGLKALEQIKKLRPHVALVDIGLPDKDGIEVTQALHENAPDVKVIILGMPDMTDEIMTCIEAGAVGYVIKEASFDYLVETIRLANRGESFCSPRMAASLFSRVAELSKGQIPESSVKLTPREVEIINRVADGLSNKEIAQRLSIEPQTVKNHIHNILDKLQLHNRLEAVEYARERKLLTKNHKK
ncbi:response regulator transcription factor [candidate division KSB1 bacterium]|nr:response regulator transcription factor [candidate division KSB1 bacterium]